MKKSLFAVVLTLMAICVVNAQTDRKAVAKMTEKELNDKASKAARKEAKNLAKDGWQIAPGALPIDKQLDKTYRMQYEQDDYGYPMYIMGEAMSIGQTYDAAKMQALELAKQNMAGQIQTEVTALIENTVANNQLGEEEAASVTKSVMASKNLISQSIGRVVTVMEVYRTDAKTKNKEVLVRIAYNSDMARKAAMNAVKKQLEQEGVDLHGKLDKLLENK